MGVLTRIAAGALLCLLSSAPLAVASTLETQEPVAAFLVTTQKAEKGLAGVTLRQAALLEKLAEARRRCRAWEREESSESDGRRRPKWSREWMKTERTRSAVRSKVLAVIEPWHRSLQAIVEEGEGPPSARSREEVARASLQIVDAWIAVSEPDVTRRDVSTSFPAFARALSWTADADDRRSTLGSIADRLSSTPGVSDLDVLAEVVAWNGIFFGGRSAEDRLDLLTADLMLIFTERGADGVSISGSTLYRPGRCGDRGFGRALRDGSDQVRHACWALRLFARAKSAEQTEQLLQMKEARDAKQRGEPINLADLALNRACRELVDEFRAAAPEGTMERTFEERLRAKFGDGE